MIDLTEQEKQQLLAAINVAIRSSQNAIEAANVLLPIAAKLSSPPQPDGDA